jgi:hypothetical protein
MDDYNDGGNNVLHDRNRTPLATKKCCPKTKGSWQNFVESRDKLKSWISQTNLVFPPEIVLPNEKKRTNSEVRTHFVQLQDLLESKSHKCT